MLVALAIAAIPLLIIYRLKANERGSDKFLKNLSVTLIGILLIQIVLGTQVREQIDEISKSLQYTRRELWIGRLDNLFFIHRSFSWFVLFACLLLWWKARPYEMLQKRAMLILVSVLATIALGTIMAFLHIPALAQPLHLLFASILMLTVFAFRLGLK